MPITNSTVDSIGIKTNDGIFFVKEDDILYCEADGSYTILHLHSNKTKKIPKSITKIHVALSSNIFIRIHRSHIINLNFLSSYFLKDRPFVKMLNGKQLPVSRTWKENFLNSIRKF